MGLALALVYIALNLLSPADMVPSLTPYRPGLVLALLSLPLSLVTRIQTPEIGKLRTQFLLAMLFFAFASCSWLPHGGLGANLAVFLNYTAPIMIMYFVGLVQLRSPGRLQHLRTTLMAVAIFVIAVAFTQVPFVRATGESTPYVLASGSVADSNEVRIRGLGILNDPNIFGQFLLLILPLLFVGKKKSGLGPGYFLAIPFAALLVVGIYFTDSRGAEIGLGVLIGLFLMSRFKKAGVVGALIIGPLSLVVINATRSRTVSMAGGLDRLAIWSDGMAFFKSSPIWGIGVGGFAERDNWTAHNSYLLCAAEVGLLGFFLWTSLIVVTLIQLNRVSKVVGESDPLARWAAAVKLSLGGYLFTSFFLSCTYSPLLFLLLGMAGAIIVAAGGDEAIPLQGTKWPAKALGLCVCIITLIYVMLRLRVV
jgi:putative inorganic carbon (HCO3(-)) transporter